MAIAPEKIVVEPGSGRVVSMPSTEAIFKVQGDQTSGAFSIAEIVLQPQSFTPPHVHEKTDEISYIVEGELGVMVAEEEFQAAAGAFVVRPRGVPHALWNVPDRAVRLLDIYTPAGLEAFFVELSRLFSASAPPSPE